MGRDKDARQTRCAGTSAKNDGVQVVMGGYVLESRDAGRPAREGGHTKATAHGPAWEGMCEKDGAGAGKGGGTYKGDGAQVGMGGHVRERR